MADNAKHKNFSASRYTTSDGRPLTVHPQKEHDLVLSTSCQQMFIAYLVTLEMMINIDANLFRLFTCKV